MYFFLLGESSLETVDALVLFTSVGEWDPSPDSGYSGPRGPSTY